MTEKYRVTGHILVESLGFRPSTRSDYEIVVAFEKTEDNQKVLHDYVRWYLEVDLEKEPSMRHQVFTPKNCACALVTYYFRDQHLRFHEKSVVWEPKPPEMEPTVSGVDYRLWVVKRIDSEVFTAANAGWDLFERCGHGKISVEDARELVRQKYLAHNFPWHEVLAAFSKQGGRYTDKYLRRD
jgi:hypothetical protein